MSWAWIHKEPSKRDKRWYAFFHRPQGLNSSVMELSHASIVGATIFPVLGRKAGVVMGERTAGMFSGRPCNGRVLIMDDEADIRKVVRLTLEKAGYEVMEAEDGEKGIQEIQRDENPILMDVIICDIRMPKINGVQAIQYFQTQFPRVPLIVMTGHPDIGMATEFLQSGISEYLVKPVDSEKLRAAVAKAVESKDHSFI